MADEVGSGQVPIFPTFKGFRKATAAEVDAATADGANRFKTGFGRAGVDSGKLAGLGFKGAFAVSASGAADATVKQLNAAVASASSQLSAARLKEQDAAGKVRVAEAALAEARSKNVAGSARLVAAEEKAAAAARVLDAAQDKTKASTDLLSAAQQKLAASARTGADAAASALSRTSSATSAAGFRAGSQSGSSFSSGFSSVLGGAGLAGAVGGFVSSITTQAIAAVRSFAQEALQASDSTDKFKQTLNFADVDPATIAALTKQTRQYANETVYDLQTIQNTTAQLAANGVPHYEELAEAAGNLNAVAGGTADTYKSVALVLTQTAGAGKLTTQNWNQLANAIPGASGRIQEALKKDGAYTGNFRDEMEKGHISADAFNKALLELGSQPVAVAAAKSTTTFEGALGNLSATIVGSVADALNTVKPQITDTINDVTSLVGELVQAGHFFGQIPAPILAAAAALGIMALAGPKVSAGLIKAGVATVSLNTKFQTLRAEAAVAGARLPTVAAGLTTVATAARGAGSAILGVFGGPVGLAVTAGITIITSALAAWKTSTDAQEQSVQDLTAALDQNTGAVTAAARQNIFDDLNTGDLKGTIDAVEAIGISSEKYIDALSGSKAVRQEYANYLKSVADKAGKAAAAADTQTDAGIKAYRGLTETAINANKAYESFAKESGVVASAQGEVAKKTRAGIKATDDSGDSAKAATPKFATLADAVTAAFEHASDAGKISSAMATLAKGLQDTDTGFGTLTADGIANTNNLASVISAMADSAGNDQAKFVGSVTGLLDSLRAQGIDVSGVMKQVFKTLDAGTRAKYSVLLDGSQSIAEAKRVVEANIAVAKSQALLADPSDRHLYNQSIELMKKDLADLNKIQSTVTTTTKQYGEAAQAASTKAANAAKSDTAEKKKAAEAAKKLAAQQLAFANTIVKSIDTKNLFGADGLVRDADSISSVYEAFIARINRARDKGKITAKQRKDLIGDAKDWKDDATQAAQAAADAIANVFSSMNDFTGFNATVSSGAQSAIDAVLDAFNAKGISAAVRDQMIQTINDIDSASNDAIEAAKTWLAPALSSMYTNVDEAINGGYLEARDKIEASFQQGLITKDARDAALGSIDDLVDAAKSSISDLGDALTSALNTWANIPQLSSEAQSITDAIEAAFAAGAIDSTVESTLYNAVKNSDKQLSDIATRRSAIADKLASANQDLSSAISLRDTYKQTVSDAVRSFGALGKSVQLVEQTVTQRVGDVLFTSTKQVSTGTDSMIQSLKDSIAKTNAFQKTIAQLKALGLDDVSYKQLIDEFAQTGSTADADALLAAGADTVHQVADLQNQLTDAGEQLGDVVSKTLYQAGVDSNQQLVDGLTAEDSALADAATSIATTLVNGIRNVISGNGDLSVFEAMGQGAVSDLIAGLESGQGALEAAVAGILTTSSSSALQSAFDTSTSLLDGKRIYLQQNIYNPVTETDAQALNDGLALAGGKFNA